MTNRTITLPFNADALTIRDAKLAADTLRNIIRAAKTPGYDSPERVSELVGWAAQKFEVGK